MKAICIDNTNAEEQLTIGKEYTVINFINDRLIYFVIQLVDDGSTSICFMAQRFKGILQ